MKTCQRNRWSVLVLVLLLLFPASGCDGLPGLIKLPGEKDPVTLRFATAQHFGFSRAFYEALLPAFAERYPHITIELAPPVRAEDLENCAGPDIACAALDNIDVMAVAPWDMPEIAQRDVLMDLSTQLDDNTEFGKDDFHGGVLTPFVREGKTLAVPAAATFYAMHYNPVLFDEAGEPYPELDWTWTDFLSTAQRLTNRQEGTYGYAAYSGDSVIVPIIYQNNGSVFDDIHAPGRVIFDDPYTIETLDWYAGLIYNHHIAPTEEEAYEAFGGATSMVGALATGVQQGKVAMWPAMLVAPAESSTMHAALPPQWGVAPLPRNARSATIGAVLAYGIPVTSRDSDASWLWIAFLTGQEHGHMLPARKSVLASFANSEELRPDIVATAQTVMENDVLLNVFTPRALAEPYGAFWSAVQRVMGSEVGAEEALMEAERRFSQPAP